MTNQEKIQKINYLLLSHIGSKQELIKEIQKIIREGLEVK